MSDAKSTSRMEPAVAVSAAELVEYQDGGVVSRQLAKTAGAGITAFAFDAGQQLSEHSSPFDAYVLVLEGTAELVIGGRPRQCAAGTLTLMPANVPHAVNAPERFKMILVMIRGE